MFFSNTSSKVLGLNPSGFTGSHAYSHPIRTTLLPGPEGHVPTPTQSGLLCCLDHRVTCPLPHNQGYSTA